MPTAKETRVFRNGRQNSDNDPRLIPNGEYIRLVNGRIARSEGNGVGALENTLGNESVSTFVDNTAVVIGSIRHMATETLYYFIKGSEEDAIYEYNEITDVSRPLLRDDRGILNFNVDFLITGVNIIGEGDNRLLLWTDGFNPPRKVNISRAFERLSGDINGFTEQEISVEKNPPLFPPGVTAVDVQDIQDEDERERIDKEENLREKFVRFAFRWRYEDDEYSVFSPFSQAGFIPGPFQFDRDTGAVTGMENQIKALDISFNTGPREVVEIDLLYKEDGSENVYVVETFNKADREWQNGILLGEIVENQFTGNGVATFEFADRLRLTDPILDVARGVEGDTNLTTDFTFERGELGAPDTITLGTALTENEIVVVRYYNNAESIRFSSNKLYRVLPEDQLRRVFDNVPIRAKTQEIIQNRIVYGNYVDRYDLEDVLKTYTTVTNPDGSTSRVLSGTRTEEIVVDLSARLSEPITTENRITGVIGERSLKSDRNYELGIVYLDNLGRQTPVLTSENNTISIPIDRANKINRISLDINSKAPEWATAYRFFVKQNRGQHFNIIPLEAQLQPDDNRFVWFRLTPSDVEKVSSGDYLNIKITNAMFAYLEDDNKLQVRVEEIGPQGRNFLETTPPRTGEIVYNGPDIDGSPDPRNGEVLDEGEIFTAQQSGVWMKVRNVSELNQDFATQTATAGRAIARSNNARGTVFRPIKGDLGTSTWQDRTFYYRGGNIGATELNAEAVTFGGTYVSGSDAPFTDAIVGPTDGFSPMRVEVEIVEGLRWRYSWWLSPSHTSPSVVRQTNLELMPLPVVNLDDTTSLPIPSAPITLVNGAQVVFNLVRENYNVGDRFVVTYRNPDNFMWRAYDAAGEGPNSVDRNDLNARTAHVMFTGNSNFDNGINGRSRIRLGVEDGQGRRTDGNPIALPLGRNEIITQDIFYDNFEEMIFEEGYWTSGDNPTFTGTDREGGGFGIHQMGFYRGLPTTAESRRTLEEQAVRWNLYLTQPAIGILNAIFGEGLQEKNAWRLISGAPSTLMGTPESDPLPLHGFIQSGVANQPSNAKKNDIRIESIVQITQGSGANPTDLNSLDLVLETVPEENVSDIYFEIGQTFPCLNGIHFGNEMSHSQRVMQEVGFDQAGNETQEVSPVSVDLDYFNCFAWSNGVESCVIRDEYLGNRLDAGAKASSVVDEYEQRENFSNLIFSGTFSQDTSTNGLNEFSSFAVATRDIIKEMDEQDGSIQHLFSRDTDLFVFQEDKVNKVLSDKNALFGADGATNLTSARPFLGQITPVVGEFGISREPESFTVYGNRMYWTDRSRGSVLRYGGDGLTEISNAGLRDFFRDELAEDYGTTRKPLAVGSYDDYHDQYILSLREPLNDPTIARLDLPLNISRQAFLSRTDACRYPEEDLQYIEVYEFYTENEPAGFQLGDIIYTDEARTSIFLGDNDWFVWFDTEGDIDLVSTSITDTTGLQMFEYTDDHLNSPMPGQTVTISSRDANPTDYTGTVVSYNRNGNGATSTIGIRIDGDQNVADANSGIDYEISINYKFVINIDNFGFVRAKADCVGITPPNHDAIRISISSYPTPQEACGKGLVARIVYHNGDDATPDVGDSIYDTPYASDEYIAGCYMKGRTQKQGWYQMFDGDDLEDFVIRILQGKVVEKRRCAEITAGRRRLLTSENPSQRRENESDDRLATRVCALIPTQERWFNGENESPVLGDSIFENNFTLNTAPAGFYAIEGGFYIRVTELGVVSFIGRCSETICVDDVIRANLLCVQNQESNLWNFKGIGVIPQDLPEVDANEAAYALDGTDQTLTFNGTILSLGAFRNITYSWYYLAASTPLTERDLINNGVEVGRVDGHNSVGEVEEYVQTGLLPFQDYQHIFVVAVDGIRITTEVLSTRTLRDVNPDAPTIAVTEGDLTAPVPATATLTATVTSDPRDTFTGQWNLDGVAIEGQTELTIDLSLTESADFGDYTFTAFYQGLTLTSDPLTAVQQFPPAVRIDVTFTDDQTEAVLTANVVDPDQPAGVDFTYQWFRNGADLGLATQMITITEVGTYEVLVTDADGLETRVCEIVASGNESGQLNDGPVGFLMLPALAFLGDELTAQLTSSDLTHPDGLVHTFTQDGLEVVPSASLGDAHLTNHPVPVTVNTLPSNFRFTVEDPLGATAEDTHIVENQNPPPTSNIVAIESGSDGNEVPAGQDVVFRCDVVDNDRDGNDDRVGGTYIWTGGSNGQEIQPFDPAGNFYTSTGSNQVRIIRCLYRDSANQELAGTRNQSWAFPLPIPPAGFVQVGAIDIDSSILVHNGVNAVDLTNAQTTGMFTLNFSGNYRTDDVAQFGASGVVMIRLVGGAFDGLSGATTIDGTTAGQGTWTASVQANIPAGNHIGNTTITFGTIEADDFDDLTGTTFISVTNAAPQAGLNVNFLDGNAAVAAGTNITPTATLVDDDYDGGFIRFFISPNQNDRIGADVPTSNANGGGPYQATATFTGDGTTRSIGAVYSDVGGLTTSGSRSKTFNASCSAGYSVGDGSYSLSNGCASLGFNPTGVATISCSGTGCFSTFTGNINSGNFSRPNPTCPSGGTPNTSTVFVSGAVSDGTNTVGASGSRSYTADTPSATYTCSGTPSGSGGNFRVTQVSESRNSATCTDTTPATLAVSGSNIQCFDLSPTAGGPAGGSAGSPSRVWNSTAAVNCPSVSRNGVVTVTPTGGCNSTTVWPSNPNVGATSTGAIITGAGSTGFWTGLTATLSFTNPGRTVRYTCSGTGTSDNPSAPTCTAGASGTTTDTQIGVQGGCAGWMPGESGFTASGTVDCEFTNGGITLGTFSFGWDAAG